MAPTEPQRRSTWRELNPLAEQLKAEARAKKSRAGHASGAARRALSRKHRRHSQRDGLALTYRVQQINRRRFTEGYGRLMDDLGIQHSDRGLQTAWVLYAGDMACYRVKGQDFRTTNTQRAIAMAKRGRPRCGRTIQRTHRRLALLGLVATTHVKRRGERAGQRDCLAVRMLQPFVALSSTTATARRAVVAVTPDSAAQDAPGPLAPPDGGRDRTPAAPASTEEQHTSGAVEGSGGSPGAQPAVLTAERRVELERHHSEAEELLRELESLGLYTPPAPVVPDNGSERDEHDAGPRNDPSR